MKKIFLFFLLFYFLFSSQKTHAAIYINEFASDTEGTIADPDWVEIYNSGPDSVELSLYRLRDNTSTNKKDLEGTLAAGSFATFDWSNKLNKSGDVIKLLLIADETNIVNQVGYGDVGSDISAPSVGQSAGRETDGSTTWVIFSTSTKNSINNTSTPTSIPTPTPAPSQTSTPTSTPTKTPTSKPTASLSSTSTPRATTVAINLGKELTSSESPKDILGTLSAEPSIEPKKQEVKTLGASENNLSKILIGLGAIIILSGAGIFLKSYISRKV